MPTFNNILIVTLIGQIPIREIKTSYTSLIFVQFNYLSILYQLQLSLFIGFDFTSSSDKSL